MCALFSLQNVDGVRDSKKISKKKQVRLFGDLKENSIYAVVPANLNMIDRQGIYLARNNAMIWAAKILLECLDREKIEVDKVVIDGKWSDEWKDKFEKGFGKPVECIIGADDIIYEVGAASIVARVYADALFHGWGTFYPGYGMENDHGSPSKTHYEALRQKGPSPVHRLKGYAKGWWKKIMEGEI